MTPIRRLKRGFAIDIETCPKCGGMLRVITRIEHPDVIATILTVAEMRLNRHNRGHQRANR